MSRFSYRAYLRTDIRNGNKLLGIIYILGKVGKQITPCVICNVLYAYAEVLHSAISGETLIKQMIEAYQRDPCTVFYEPKPYS